MSALASPCRPAAPPQSGRPRSPRLVLALALAAASLAVAGAGVAQADAAAPVPCTPAGTFHGMAKFDCQFYPAGGAPVQAADGHTVGTLHPGTNWVLCQRVGGLTRSGAYYNDNWAFTLADDNAYGWVNAVWARGGDNNGGFAGVPGCAGSTGTPPGGGGGAPPSPPPAPAPGTIPAEWSNGPVNAPAWHPAKRSYGSIQCGSRSIPANVPPQSVSHGWTPRTQAIVDVIRGPLFGWTSVGGGANGTRSGHIANSYHYCGRAVDSFAPGVRAGTRASGAGLRASWRLANWAAHNAAALNVSQVIFFDRIWTADDGGWSRYTNDGGSSNTLQHRDHVHISVY